MLVHPIRGGGSQKSRRLSFHGIPRRGRSEVMSQARSSPFAAEIAFAVAIPQGCNRCSLHEYFPAGIRSPLGLVSC